MSRPKNISVTVIGRRSAQDGAPWGVAHPATPSNAIANSARKTASFARLSAGVLIIIRTRRRREGSMAHDPALDAHEHAEHAEHAAHERDPFISRVAITVAVLAVLAAVAGSLETVEGGKALGASSEAVLHQDEASDAWNEFQADGLKRYMYMIAADSAGSRAGEYKEAAKKKADKQADDRKKALKDESERDALIVASQAHEDRHHWLTGSATLFEIGIAMSTVAIITRRHWLWQAAMLFGACGLALLGVSYLA
jgi:hypothetical protein